MLGQRRAQQRAVRILVERCWSCQVRIAEMGEALQQLAIVDTARSPPTALSAASSFCRRSRPISSSST
jgi:hypothetical protein